MFLVFDEIALATQQIQVTALLKPGIFTMYMYLFLHVHALYKLFTSQLVGKVCQLGCHKIV